MKESLFEEIEMKMQHPHEYNFRESFFWHDLLFICIGLILVSAGMCFFDSKEFSFKKFLICFLFSALPVSVAYWVFSGPYKVIIAFWFGILFSKLSDGLIDGGETDDGLLGHLLEGEK